MVRYIVRRTFFSLLALWMISMVAFVATRISGDVTYLLVGMDATEQEIAAIRTQYGLDRALPIQYLIFAGHALQGDFGTSIKYGVPALDLVLNRLPQTIILSLTGFTLALLIGVPLGIMAASRRSSVVDYGATAFALIGQAMPGFWVGIMLQLVFSVNLGWLPTGGSESWRHLILPATTVSWFSIAAFMRLTRSSMIEALDADYVKFARVKGNSEYVVVLKHALRNAVIPLVTFAGMNLGALLGGAVVVESIFAWPGVGQLMIAAISARDYPTVQAAVLVTAAMLISINLAVDMLYGLLDPRIRNE